MRLRAELQRTGGNTTGFEVPADVVAALDGGGRPKVAVTVNGYSFRSSIAKMGGSHWLGVSAERRTEGGLTGGEVYDLDIELDATPRVVEVPGDLRAALDADPAASAFWETLSFSSRRYHVDQLTAAKTAETRARRVAKSIGLLAEGRAR
jgi:hypothetical protein